MKFCAPTCRFLSDGTQFFSLMSSIRKTWNRSKELQALGSYRTICREVYKGGCAITKGKKWTDCCEICVTYDAQVYPLLNNMYDETKASFESVLPDYFKAWQNECERDEDFCLQDFQQEVSPDYCERYQKYINAHR